MIMIMPLLKKIKNKTETNKTLRNNGAYYLLCEKGLQKGERYYHQVLAAQERLRSISTSKAEVFLTINNW